MLIAGFAQEVITPPQGVELQGYSYRRFSKGMHDDLFVKVILCETAGNVFGFVIFDLISLKDNGFEELERRIVTQYGRKLPDNLIILTIHTHTGPMFPADLTEADELTRYSFDLAMSTAIRALGRALLNLAPCELVVDSAYNNLYGFVRCYWMKNGTVVTNPGRCNPDIDKPESDLNRTIGIMAIKQNNMISALICNIANHDDTIGGNLISADWDGRFAQEIQYRLNASIPVMVVDDASGDINHFDFHQKINQSSYSEATRIGRGYGAIVMAALDKLESIVVNEVEIINGSMTIPHRRVTEEEYLEAKRILAEIPDIKKNGPLESQDLASNNPAALRIFARHTVDCYEKRIPSHNCRLTVFKIGKAFAAISLPGEPFNGITVPSEMQALVSTHS